MLEKNAEKWGDKVRIVGLSGDNSAQVVKTRVDEKGWKKVEHYWSGGKPDMDLCKEKYGVNGIPHVVLIDMKGKIFFAGHPMETNLEEDINSLLEGKEASPEEPQKEGEKPDESDSKDNSTQI